ncbi:helix-turn-helix transcriptional regulator [Henriciella aquimarina]|uniref:helix-turn-helix transcriptional regulator n=1 Tax=Henriciella aquimarina TaxID=545261 RepID=UPI000A041557|nr:helix-turn-helix domain-containing protein [Henriciella aquimarina]
MVTQLLSKRTVSQIVGVHEQTLMRYVREGRFPKPLRTGDIGSAVRWREQDINDWIEERAAHAGGAS